MFIGLKDICGFSVYVEARTKILSKSGPIGVSTVHCFFRLAFDPAQMLTKQSFQRLRQGGASLREQTL